MSKWRSRTPRLGFSTMFAAEAMLDGFLARANVGDSRNVSNPDDPRKGAVTVRLRVCTDMPQRQRANRYLPNLPRRWSIPAAEGRVPSAPLETTPKEAEELETATMFFTALTTAESADEDRSKKLNVGEGNQVRLPETDVWESVTPMDREPDDDLFVFVDACEDDL